MHIDSPWTQLGPDVRIALFVCIFGGANCHHRLRLRKVIRQQLFPPRRLLVQLIVLLIFKVGVEEAEQEVADRVACDGLRMASPYAMSNYGSNRDLVGAGSAAILSKRYALKMRQRGWLA